MHHSVKTLFILPLLIAGIKPAESKKRVCVIGAGISGLVSAKYLAMYPEEFEPVVFEKQSDSGGMWIYTDSSSVDDHGLPVHSSAYKNLRSNVPKEIIEYPDYNGILGENRSFVSRETMLRYLRNFTDHYDLRRYIQFDTNVEKVSPLDDMKWLVMTRDLNDNKTEKTTCDAVMIGSGNTATGNIPKIPGIETFSGRVMHSHLYRTPDPFLNQTVVMLGASFSGTDIGIDISKLAKTVYLSHRHDKREIELPDNMDQIPGVVAADNNDLILSDNSRIKADALIFCTGYIHEFPFLNADSGVVVEENGKYVKSIYKHMINIERPTMAFLNVPEPAFPMLVPHSQAQFYVGVLRGKVRLPSREEMLKDAEVPAGKPKSMAHTMIADVLSYLDELSVAAGYDPLPHYYEAGWRLLLPEIVHNPMHFQEKNLYVHEDGNVEMH